MNKSYKIEVIEFLLFGIIWIGIFSIPFFNQWGYATLDWDKLLSEWFRIFGFFMIFLINILLLIPKYLISKKYKTYIFSAISMILVVSVAGLFFNSILFPEPLKMPPMNLGSGIPMELGSGMPAPIGFKPERVTDYNSMSLVIIANLIISFLVVGSSTTFKVIGQWLIAEDRQKDLEKEQLKTELAFLRHQVSPHFFMNTLNNIHSLIDLNTEDAKDAVIRLSTMMRYLLYETSQGHTSLKKEIGFIESYISLMQLRFSKHVKVALEVPEGIPDLQIPPMLFISLLENAFKHGVSYQKDSFVLFSIEISDNKINCIIKNSKHPKASNPEKRYSGIGIANVKKSLELHFGNNFIYEVNETDTEYQVNLSVPIE
ncbi:MAG: histidine kinase [Prolixibacteraceae bacterium]|jgi:sensor histidine kinase YesM|nr:histidine kinase [Prolixibacteraceae bacterium]